MLEINNLGVSYGTKEILKDLNLSVNRGELLGIIGPNGAGKTTLFRAVSGLLKPTGGSVIVGDRSIEKMSRKELAQNIAVVPQSSFIPPLFTIEETIALGRFAKRKLFDSGIGDHDAVAQIKKEVGISHLSGRFCSGLSGGERQEVVLARALIQDTPIILLDEPTSALDIRHQLKLMTLLRSLMIQRDLTAVMIIHDLNLAARFCDRIAVIHEGTIHSIGTPKEVLTENTLAQVWGVSSHICAMNCLGKSETPLVTALTTLEPTF